MRYTGIQMKRFTSPTQKTGEIGETVAVRFLEKKGFQIVERNYTVRGGEVDIVARENNQYFFCEVKAVNVSRQRETWPVWQNFTPAKLRRLQQTAQLYAKQRGLVLDQISLMGITVYLDQETRRAKCELVPLVG